MAYLHPHTTLRNGLLAFVFKHYRLLFFLSNFTTSICWFAMETINHHQFQNYCMILKKLVKTSAFIKDMGIKVCKYRERAQKVLEESAFAMPLIVFGVVLQHPPNREAPASFHFLTYDTKSSPIIPSDFNHCLVTPS